MYGGFLERKDTAPSNLLRVDGGLKSTRYIMDLIFPRIPGFRSVGSALDQVYPLDLSYSTLAEVPAAIAEDRHYAALPPFDIQSGHPLSQARRPVMQDRLSNPEQFRAAALLSARVVHAPRGGGCSRGQWRRRCGGTMGGWTASYTPRRTAQRRRPRCSASAARHGAARQTQSRP